MGKEGTDGLWLVAAEDFIANIDGIDKLFKEDVTRVRADDPILEGRRHLFRPMDATYKPDVEAATAGPGERRGEQ